MSRTLFLMSLALIFGAAAPDTEIANVNGRSLTERDLQVLRILQGLPAKTSASIRVEAVRELIDRELIRQFLDRHKVTVDADQLAVVRGAIERVRDDSKLSDQELEWFRPENERVVAELVLPATWLKQVSRVVTDQQIRDHFAAHRHRLDGTRLRVSQIFRKYESGESPQKAPKTIAMLNEVRETISKGESTFGDAARSKSQAPTAGQGGDVGWIGPRGGLPAAVSDAAFGLKQGELSDVVLSPFGAHLVTVTEIEPGDLSLEDARPSVLAELSRSLWNETVAAERKTAKIVVSD